MNVYCMYVHVLHVFVGMLLCACIACICMYCMYFRYVTMCMYCMYMHVFLDLHMPHTYTYLQIPTHSYIPAHNNTY